MDEIELSAPDPSWPSLFVIERKLLAGVLADEKTLVIEHFGSTAIEGLVAKPIIDILIAVPNIGNARNQFPKKLETLGYVFWSDNPKTDRLFFVKGIPPYGKRRTHHVHVGEVGGELWNRLKFRDYLRRHPGKREEYADLKRRIAAQHRQDREAYTNAKTAFVTSIMEMTKAEVL